MPELIQNNLTKKKYKGTYLLFTSDIRCQTSQQPLRTFFILLRRAWCRLLLSAVNIINCVQCHRIFVAAGKNLTSAAVRITDRLNVILFRDKMPPAGPVARDSTSQRCSVPLPGFLFLINSVFSKNELYFYEE